MTARTSHARYMTDFEEYEVGDAFVALAPEGGYSNTMHIADVDGKKVLKGTYPTDSWQMEFYPFGRGGSNRAHTKTLSAGYSHIKLRIKPLETPFFRVAAYQFNTPAIHITMQYGATIEAVIRDHEGGAIISTLVFVAAPGASPNSVSIMFDYGLVRITVDGETLEYYDTPFGDYTWLKLYFPTDRGPFWLDIFGSSIPFINNLTYAELHIDGESVIGAAVQLWDVVLSPPDFTVVSGVGGTLDLSGVTNGIYRMVGYDEFGDSFYRYVTIVDGEIS